MGSGVGLVGIVLGDGCWKCRGGFGCIVDR